MSETTIEKKELRTEIMQRMENTYTALITSKKEEMILYPWNKNTQENKGELEKYHSVKQLAHKVKEISQGLASTKKRVVDNKGEKTRKIRE